MTLNCNLNLETYENTECVGTALIKLGTNTNTISSTLIDHCEAINVNTTTNQTQNANITSLQNNAVQTVTNSAANARGGYGAGTLVQNGNNWSNSGGPINPLDSTMLPTTTKSGNTLNIRFPTSDYTIFTTGGAFPAGEGTLVYPDAGGLAGQWGPLTNAGIAIGQTAIPEGFWNSLYNQYTHNPSSFPGLLDSYTEGTTNVGYNIEVFVGVRPYNADTNVSNYSHTPHDDDVMRFEIEQEGIAIQNPGNNPTGQRRAHSTAQRWGDINSFSGGSFSYRVGFTHAYLAYPMRLTTRVQYKPGAAPGSNPPPHYYIWAHTIQVRRMHL